MAGCRANQPRVTGRWIELHPQLTRRDTGAIDANDAPDAGALAFERHRDAAANLRDRAKPLRLARVAAPLSEGVAACSVLPRGIAEVACDAFFAVTVATGRAAGIRTGHCRCIGPPAPAARRSGTGLSVLRRAGGESVQR